MKGLSYRNSDMIHWYLKGYDCVELAVKYGITKQRVHAILLHYGINTRDKSEATRKRQERVK